MAVFGIDVSYVHRREEFPACPFHKAACVACRCNHSGIRIPYEGCGAVPVLKMGSGKGILSQAHFKFGFGSAIRGQGLGCAGCNQPANRKRSIYSFQIAHIIQNRVHHRFQGLRPQKVQSPCRGRPDWHRRCTQTCKDRTCPVPRPWIW